MSSSRPFRWNIAKRNELGSLVSVSRAELADWVGWELGRSAGSTIVQLEGRTSGWLTKELTAAAARILVRSDDGELFFVGRSLDSVFDFLSGVFTGKPWNSRIHLLPFSVGSPNGDHRLVNLPSKRRALERHLAALSLTSRDIIRRKRPTALIDIVYSGNTLRCLVGLLEESCEAAKLDLKQFRRKLRLIGLTRRTKTSPKTRRWQQHAQWTARLPKSAIKNVSIPEPLYEYLGAGQTKLADSFEPSRWDDAKLSRPQRREETHLAISLALALYDLGRRKAVRQTLARLMAEQRAMHQSWFRALMREVVAR